MRSNNCTQTNPQVPLASLTEYYKLVTLISKYSSSFSSTTYGNFTHNPQTSNFLYYNPYTQDTTKILNDTLAKLFEGLLISRLK